MKDKRKDCASKLLNKLNHLLQPNMLWFVSDENNSCQDQIMNSQGNRWLALSPQDVPIVMKTKHLVLIMVFRVVTGDIDVMPPFIFPHGLTYHGGLHQVTGRVSTSLDREGGWWKTPRLSTGLCTMPH